VLRDGAHLEITVFGIWIAFLVATYLARFQFLRDTEKPEAHRRLVPIRWMAARAGSGIVRLAHRVITDAQAANSAVRFTPGRRSARRVPWVQPTTTRRAECRLRKNVPRSGLSAERRIDF